MNATPASQPRFSVVITSYRSLRFLEDCLGSLLRSTGPDFEVLFLDNGSPEPEADWVQANIADPRLRVFKGENTRYFPGGINFLAPHARGEFLVLLNSDTKMQPDWLEKIDAYLRDTGFDGAQADVRNVYPPSRAEAGYYLDRMGLLVNIAETDLPPSRQVFCTSGSAFAIRRRVFEEIGALDETYRMYFEDIDLCWRANLFGYRLGYASGAIVEHVGQGSARKSFFPWNEFRGIRNRGLTFVKNAGPGLLAFFLVSNFVLRVVRLPVNLLTGKWGRACAEVAAVASFFYLLGPALLKRRKIQAGRRVPDSALRTKGYILSGFKYFSRLGFSRPSDQPL